jgi:hypothetical protein
MVLSKRRQPAREWSTLPGAVGNRMSLQRLVLGISSAPSSPAQRHCYISAHSLEQFLAAPGVLDGLLSELQGEEATAAPFAAQLARVQRSAIHLSVTRSRFHGLSLEEIVVLTAYTSELFSHTLWKRQLLREPRPEALAATCQSWVSQRARVVCGGRSVGKACWPLIGISPADLATSPFVIAVAPVSGAPALERELPSLAQELGFAHEHYLACTPATALDYLARAAKTEAGLRWDPFALDRRLRTLGIGLLLVEPEGVLLYLPARYHPTPALAIRTEPRGAGGK